MNTKIFLFIKLATDLGKSFKISQQRPKVPIWISKCKLPVFPFFFSWHVIESFVLWNFSGIQKTSFDWKKSLIWFFSAINLPLKWQSAIFEQKLFHFLRIFCNFYAIFFRSKFSPKQSDNAEIFTAVALILVETVCWAITKNSVNDLCQANIIGVPACYLVPKSRRTVIQARF